MMQDVCKWNSRSKPRQQNGYRWVDYDVDIFWFWTTTWL